MSHSFRDPVERDHDDIALTPGWSDLDQTLDLDTLLFSATRGTQLQPDAAPPLQSLSDVLFARATFDRVG